MEGHILLALVELWDPNFDFREPILVLVFLFPITPPPILLGKAIFITYKKSFMASLFIGSAT